MTTPDWPACDFHCLPGRPAIPCPVHNQDRYAPAGALPELQRIEAMDLRPGDTIVATLADGTALDDQQQAGLVQALASRFPGHEILVAAGFRLDVVRPENDANATRDANHGHTQDQAS